MNPAISGALLGSIDDQNAINAEDAEFKRMISKMQKETAVDTSRVALIKQL